jgi:hypothetical protein
MANKKRKRPRQRPATDAGPERPAPPPRTAQGANAERRERKQLAREARERARKQAARRDTIRRATIFLVIGAVALAAYWAITRVASPGSLSDELTARAAELGCSTVDVPVEDPSRDHLDPGQTGSYTTRPGVAGAHNATTLGTSVKVFTEPVPEENAVHSLEHGGVILYHRGDGSVPAETTDAFARLARENRPVFTAPYASFDGDVGLAFTAWNTLMTCPGGIPATDAAALAEGFVDAFACTSRAPESGTSGELC